MKAFTDYRRLFWLGGIAVLIVGFIAAAVLLPLTSTAGEAKGPAVHVPKMQNIPQGSEHLTLEAEEKLETEENGEK